jgi:carboxyl-terminal processing protease
MYTDAATKLQSHYVQNPDWAALVVRGTADLEIALGEKDFQDNNLNQLSSDRMKLFDRELHRQQTQHPVHTLADARTAVWNAAQMAQLHLSLKPAATMMEYTAAMLGGLDEYSAFLSGGQLNDLYSQIEGNFVGLGVELKAADGTLLIVNVIHNSPAERGGIKAGDKIVSVGGHPTADVSTDKAAEMLQGPEGSTVQLAVVSGDESPRQLSIRREHVDVSSVDDAKIVDANFGVGYFKLTCFQKTTNADVDQALWQLHRDGMRSLIIDLRGNPGGLLTAAVDVAQKFVDSGTIVSTRGRNPGEDYNYQAHGTGQWRLPLVILIDGDSASAAEILAGAMRDYHRADIVGVRSYGKGSVQGIFPLAVGGAGVRLTTAKFYSPLGKEFAHIGVEPNVMVQVDAKPVDGHIALPVSTGKPDDAFLNAALQVARQQVAQR